MKFKDIMAIVNRTVATFSFGFGIVRLFIGDYELAAWSLFGVSILYMVGYFAERWSNLWSNLQDDED